MNSQKMNEAIERICKKLSLMPRDEFMKLLEKHRNSDFSKMLLHSGMFEARSGNWKE